MESDTNNDVQLMEIEQGELLRKNFQSFYYMMNAKPDSKTKIFTKDVCISIDDIYNLNYLVTEKFKSHYNDAGFMINVNVVFDNKKSIFFNSWTLFEKQKWIQSEAIDSILIKWEFNAELPKFKLPQKHTLIVKMSDGIKPEEFFKIMFSGGLDEIQELDKDAYPVIASVDFIDSILGDELIEIVANWVNGLKSCDTASLFMKKMQKHKRKIAYLTKYFLTFALALCCIKFGTTGIENMNIKSIGEISKQSFVSYCYLVFILILIFTIAKNIFEFVAKSIFDALRDLSKSHTFSITNGDKNQIDKDKKNQQKVKNNIVIKMIAALVFDIVCALITNIITQVII